MPVDLGTGAIHVASAFRLPAEFKHPGFSLPPESGTSHYTFEDYAGMWVRRNLPELVTLPAATKLTPLHELSVGGAERNPAAELADTLLHLGGDLSRLTYLHVNFPDSQPLSGQGGATPNINALTPVSTLVGLNANAAPPPIRGTARSESRIMARKGPRGGPLANEYLVEPPGGDSEVARPLSHLFLELLAQRRSLLFAPALAERIYNIMFPLGILTEVNGNDGFLLVPWLTLIRGSFTSRCRHTIEFGMFLLPIKDERPDREHLTDLAPLTERNLDANEVVRIAARGDGSGPTFSWERSPQQFHLSGPLRKHLVELKHHLPTIIGNKRKIAGEWLCVDERVARALESILAGLTDPEVSIREVSEGLTASTIGQVFVHHSAIKHDESRVRVEQFADEIAQSIAMNQVISILTCTTNLDREAVAIGLANEIDGWIGNQNATAAEIYKDSSWSLYHLNPLRCFLITYDSARRDFPSNTPLQPIGWLAYIMGSLAALTEMLTSFYHEIEEPEEIQGLLGVTSDIVLNFDEIYDLDILWHAYRDVYDKCVKALHINRDYDQLLRKVSGIRAEVETESRIRTEDSVHAIGVLGAAVATFVVLIEACQHEAVNRFVWHNSWGLVLVSIFLLVIASTVLWTCWRSTSRWRYRQRARRYIAWKQARWWGDTIVPSEG
jgi:hypothetical protein